MARRKDDHLGDPFRPVELQVLRLKSEGMKEAAIASKLSYSEETIGGFLKDIYGKLGLYAEEEQAQVFMWRKDVRAVYLALERGLIATPDPIQTVHSELHLRELQIAQLLPLGLSCAQIGQRMGLATNSVRSYLHAAYTKLNTSSRITLMIHVVFHKLT